MDRLQNAILRARAERHNPPPPRRKVLLPGLAPWHAERRAQVVIAPFPRVITIGQVVQLVAAEFKLTTEEMCGACRSHQIVFPRHVAQYLAQRLTGQSLPTIGRYFNNRDHTTILSARNKIARMIENDPATRELCERLEKQLRAATQT